MRATVIVTVYKSSKPWNRRGWRWKAQNAGNNEIMAQGQGYVDKGDAIAAVTQLFGDGTSVFLRRDVGDQVILRVAQ